MDLLEEGLKRCMDKLKEKERDKVRDWQRKNNGKVFASSSLWAVALIIVPRSSRRTGDFHKRRGG